MTIASDNNGIFTFTTANAEREFIFVKSQAVVANIEDAHCSNHIAWMNGCSDCLAISYLKTFDPDQFEKLQLPKRKFSAKMLWKGNFLAPLEIKLANPTPKIQLIRQQLARALAVFFAKEKKKAAKNASEKYQEMNKITSEEKKAAIAYAAFQAIEWELLISAVEADLLAAAQEGAQTAITQLGIIDVSLESSVNAKIQEYAKQRSAEMIGKAFVNNQIVEDSAAKFVISETTKEDLEDLVEVALDKNESIEQLRERILNAVTFSDARAQLISRNEASLAQVAGSLAVWKSSGQVSRVGIRLSDAHVDVDECDELAATSYEINSVPVIPVHPNCQCTIYAIE